MVAAGGAMLVEDKIDVAANVRGAGLVLKELLCDSERRDAMRERLEADRPADAATEIARLLLSEPPHPRSRINAQPGQSRSPAKREHEEERGSDGRR
jgi:hypothetical protein